MSALHQACLQSREKEKQKLNFTFKSSQKDTFQNSDLFQRIQTQHRTDVWLHHPLHRPISSLAADKPSGNNSMTLQIKPLDRGPYLFI